MFIRTLVLISALSFVFGQDRKITPKLNPDCEACSANTTLVYIKAEGPHDTIHQLWDFTYGSPTIIYAIAGVNSTLQVEWKHERPIKFNMSEDAYYSFAMAISEICEYNDLDDLGHTNSTTALRCYPLKDVSWMQRETVLTDQETMVVVQTDKYSRHRDGIVAIKLDYLPFRDYALQLPHLIHTANSTLVDIQLANLTESRDFSSSRFALRLVLVASDDAAGSMAKGLKKSLDDEHTPGVFEIIEVKTPRCASGGAGGYMQFRPVAYTQQERSVTTSTVVHVSDFNRVQIVPTTLSRFYPDINDMVVQDMVVSFGEPQDGFYRQHNYTAWSSTFGYGAPPVETFSLFVILVISIGLAVPVLLALSGVAYVLVRRCRQRNTPTRLQEE